MASISESVMVDTHKDAVYNQNHAYKSELPIDAFEVIDLVESHGFTATNYREQGYDRLDTKRQGKGYYSVSMRSNHNKTVGICLIDAKDGQSSMKLFAGVFICDRVFPMVEIATIKHRKHDQVKLNLLPVTLGKSIDQALARVTSLISAMRNKRLSARECNQLANSLADVRRSHRNYGVTSKMESNFQETASYFSVFVQSLAILADVNWIRHHVKLSLDITEKADISNTK